MGLIPTEVPGFMVPGATPVKLRWFGERSSTLDAFPLNLATRSVEELAHCVKCSSWRNVCGYEMDRAALLALSVLPAACI